MAHIILTDEQVRLLESASGPIDVHAPDGRVLGTITRFTPQDIEAIRRFKQRPAQAGPRLSSQRLLAVLNRAQEIDKSEGITPEKMAELLRRARSGEAF